MKIVSNLIIALSFVWLFSASPLMASELDCDDLADIMKGMDLIATALENSTDVDDETSDQLGEVISALKVAAKLENSDSLTNAVNHMDRIWNDDTVSWEDDLPNFKMAIDSVIMNVERLVDRDCQ